MESHEDSEYVTTSESDENLSDSSWSDCPSEDYLQDRENFEDFYQPVHTTE
jgi:hypothetical protein